MLQRFVLLAYLNLTHRCDSTRRLTAAEPAGCVSRAEPPLLASPNRVMHRPAAAVCTRRWALRVCPFASVRRLEARRSSIPLGAKCPGSAARGAPPPGVLSAESDRASRWIPLGAGGSADEPLCLTALELVPGGQFQRAACSPDGVGPIRPGAMYEVCSNE